MPKRARDGVLEFRLRHARAAAPAIRAVPRPFPSASPDERHRAARHATARVATLTLNRPDALNVLDLAMIDALVARTAEVAADDTLRVVVLRGAGRHFMAGGDIRTFAARARRAARERAAAASSGWSSGCTRPSRSLHRMPHPVVGRVHGAVAGFGLSLMNACDLVVAADDAYFASAYRQIALTPDGGGSWSLPRIVGMRKAMEILLLGERFDAAEALRLGLVNRVVPAAELDAVDRRARPFDRRRARARAAQRRSASCASRWRARCRSSCRPRR